MDLRHIDIHDAVPKFLIRNHEERRQARRKFVRKTAKRVDVDGYAVMEVVLQDFWGDPM